MENKKVGMLILGVSIVFAIMTLIFNSSMRKFLEVSCTHGSECSMYSVANVQLWFGVAMVLLFAFIGVFIIFSKPDEKIIVKKERKKRLDLSKLDSDEKKTVQLLLKENNGMFQSDLMEKLEIGKVKTTRLLDKLEAKGFIIRKRRGMNNIVLLQNPPNN